MNMDYVYLPQILYVLRMNAERTDAGIEEYDIEQYPRLGVLLDDSYRYSLKHNPIMDWELLGECVGAERIINFSKRRVELERELEDVRKSLRVYYDGVEIAESYLKGCELGYIRRESDVKNIDFCSFSETFYVYGKPFLKLCYRLGHRFRTDAIFTEYDIPCWRIEFFHRGSLHVNHKKSSVKENRTFDEWLQHITKEPDDAAAKRDLITKRVEKIFGTSVLNDEILYDPASECYLLTEDTERQLLKDIMPVRAGDVKEIAKYTSFETLVAILQSGKMRMNSIVSMNDKTETDFLEGVFRNYKEEYEQDYDKYLFADKEFLTSFTKRIDELDMWRLYGDNARGVCMVFERDNKDGDNLYEINYINPAKDLNKVEKLIKALKSQKIKFRLNLLQEYRHFLKHSDFETEDEYRLLMSSDKPDGWCVNSENGILTPYLERELRKKGKVVKNDYPFKLSKIILGPAMKENYANMMQVFYMCHQYGYSLSVGVSAIESYR